MNPAVTLRRLSPSTAAEWLIRAGQAGAPVADGWPTEQDVTALRLAAQPTDPWPVWLVLHGDTVIGTVGLTAAASPDDENEIGYGLVPTYRGRGLGRIAVELLLCELSEHYGVRRVRARVPTANLASARLLASLGFTAALGDDATDTVWQREITGTG